MARAIANELKYLGGSHHRTVFQIDDKFFTRGTFVRNLAPRASNQQLREITSKEAQDVLAGKKIKGTSAPRRQTQSKAVLAPRVRQLKKALRLTGKPTAAVSHKTGNPPAGQTVLAAISRKPGSVPAVPAKFSNSTATRKPEGNQAGPRLTASLKAEINSIP